MQLISLIWGVISIVGMLIALAPCLGALNWLVIPFSALGIVVSAIAVFTEQTNDRNNAIAGLIMCAVATVVGGVRLAAGGGIL